MRGLHENQHLFVEILFHLVNDRVPIEVCRRLAPQNMLEYLEPIRDKRKKLEKDKDSIQDILDDGSKKAKQIAHNTMAEVRQLIFG